MAKHRIGEGEKSKWSPWDTMLPYTVWGAAEMSKVHPLPFKNANQHNPFEEHFGNISTCTYLST